MKLEEFLQKLRTSPEEIEFSESIALIDSLYNFSPTEFQNGAQRNRAGENSGSCKIFAFAKRHKLSQDETLHCFGRYYREDVLKNPEAQDHGNIRNFMRFGWAGVSFTGEALSVRG